MWLRIVYAISQAAKKGLYQMIIGREEEIATGNCDIDELIEWE